MRTYTKALARAVHERDKWCVICGSPHNLTIAHVKNKGMGGTRRKDTADNLVCLCIDCHTKMDNGSGGYVLRQRVEEYLRGIYGTD